MAKRQLYKHQLQDIFQGTTHLEWYAFEKDGEKIEKVITQFDNSKRIERK